MLKKVVTVYPVSARQNHGGGGRGGARGAAGPPGEVGGVTGAHRPQSQCLQECGAAGPARAPGQASTPTGTRAESLDASSAGRRASDLLYLQHGRPGAGHRGE